MSNGLAALAVGKSSILDSSDSDNLDDGSCYRAEVNKAKTSAQPKKVIRTKTKDPIAMTVLSDSPMSVGTLDPSGDDVPSPLHTKFFPNHEKDIPTHEQIFARSANLLRESLGINYTVLLDVSAPASAVTQDTVLGDKNTADETLGLHQEGKLMPKLSSSPETLILEKKTIRPPLSRTQSFWQPGPTNNTPPVVILK
jgi:hypothetical protein